MSFERKVDDFLKKSRRRLRNVARESVQQTMNIANEPQAKGGRMPVDTGFLRASIAGAVGTMPSGPSKRGGGSIPSVGLDAALGAWKPDNGEAFYAGWTANYARFMEYRYGFMRGAAELWDQTVTREARRAKQAGL